MILLKPHVWEKSDSRVKRKNALGQSDCRIFKLSYLINYWSYKVDFLHVGTYLSTLQIDDEILDGRGQTCPGMSNQSSANQSSEGKIGNGLYCCVFFYGFTISMAFQYSFPSISIS